MWNGINGALDPGGFRGGSSPPAECESADHQMVNVKFRDSNLESKDGPSTKEDIFLAQDITAWRFHEQAKENPPIRDIKTHSCLAPHPQSSNHHWA